MASSRSAVILSPVNWLAQRIGFWIFLLSGSAVLGFDPEQDGLDGIRNLVRKRFPEVRQLPTRELAAWLDEKLQQH